MIGNLSHIEQLTYKTVSEIQGIKHDNRQAPGYALLHEVYNSLRPELDAGFEPHALGALQTLYRRGLIEFHSTINGIPMFGIKHNDNGED